MTGPILTKNQCDCTTEPADDQRNDVLSEAHIQVAEWRLHKVQSPIELNHDDSIHHDHFEPLEFHGHWDTHGIAAFTNNGFTATLRFSDKEHMPYLKGGPLHEDEYEFEQLHFHWSEDDHSGCEHIFEGRKYSMEAHVVHFNKKYKDFQEAHDKHDGLAVVAFFLQASGNEDNQDFSKLSTSVLDIISINSSVKVSTGGSDKLKHTRGRVTSVLRITSTYCDELRSFRILILLQLHDDSDVNIRG
ncbi:unnamed protein product [Acanthoscelides obtectus]|uniref:Alpha-carbonic anhydrase domain-containing protein n=1 Tax=Acanthoscelides obtectus TaxID=200917 RepID=A0A9P0PBA5_ACAOB|nr:unnamed protein product [Acanthoscelides obtectus]CAK1667476.1 Carbonic anhydrase 2 [Acanthoscelides obtectus]